MDVKREATLISYLDAGALPPRVGAKFLERLSHYPIVLRDLAVPMRLARSNTTNSSCENQLETDDLQIQMQIPLQIALQIPLQITFESVLDHFWITLGSLLDQFWIHIGYIDIYIYIWDTYRIHIG